MSQDQTVPAKEQTSQKFILAAGGLIWRQRPYGRELAVIHRKRYGDWCLPKGKLQEGESWEEAACREVKEETGCEVKITDFAGMISYMAKGVPKLVLFYHMAPVGDCSFHPSEEVEKVEWLSLKDAVAKLEYSEEVRLLMGTDTSNSLQQRRGILGRILLIWNRLIRTKRWRRLASSIPAYKAELEQRTEHQQASGQTDTGWLEGARKLISQAELALQEGDVDKGWKCFDGARRMEIVGLRSDDQRKAQITVLREESAKLNPWRKKATERLLGIEDTATPPSIERIYLAALIRDEHYSNQAYKGAVLRGHILRLALLLAAIIAIFFLLVGFDYLHLNLPAALQSAAQSDILQVTSTNTSAVVAKETTASATINKAAESTRNKMGLLASIAMFGLLGGTLSAALAATKITKASRIPELTSAVQLTMLRLLMGVASAIVVYVFLVSKLLIIVDVDISEASTSIIYVISFVAGFTERLVLKAVERVAGE